LHAKLGLKVKATIQTLITPPSQDLLSGQEIELQIYNNIILFLLLLPRNTSKSYLQCYCCTIRLEFKWSLRRVVAAHQCDNNKNIGTTQTLALGKDPNGSQLRTVMIFSAFWTIMAYSSADNTVRGSSISRNVSGNSMLCLYSNDDRLCSTSVSLR
jgi:hypothetical protein